MKMSTHILNFLKSNIRGTTSEQLLDYLQQFTPTLSREQLAKRLHESLRKLRINDRIFGRPIPGSPAKKWFIKQPD